MKTFEELTGQTFQGIHIALGLKAALKCANVYADYTMLIHDHNFSKYEMSIMEAFFTSYIRIVLEAAGKELK